MTHAGPLEGVLTCKPHVVADDFDTLRAGLVRPRKRVDMPITMIAVNISNTTAMRILLRGFASEGFGSLPAVAPSAIVPTVDTTTAAHSAACNRSCRMLLL